MPRYGPFKARRGRLVRVSLNRNIWFIRLAKVHTYLKIGRPKTSGICWESR
jgi:hypothetical protein